MLECRQFPPTESPVKHLLRFFSWACALALTAAICAGQRAPSFKMIKLKIDAKASDADQLIKLLNENGRKHNLKFQSVRAGYAYQISYKTEETASLTFPTSMPPTTPPTFPSPPDVHVPKRNAATNVSAESAVYDAHGTRLFLVRRKERAPASDLMDSVAKEIVKRLVKVRRHK